MKKINHKKKFKIRFLILIFCIFLLFSTLQNTISRYSTDVQAVGGLNTAMYVISAGYQDMNLNLGNIVPRSESYKYEFSISNYKNKITNGVSLDYELVLISTTNLPLEYKLYLNDDTKDIIAEDILYQDDNGTYFRKMTATTERFGFNERKTNNYTLIVNFPETYSNMTEYQDVIEGVKIQLNSRQVID